MKRAFITIILTVISLYTCLAGGDRLFERVYISTDKACYVAGDRVWLSAFCTDIAGGGVLSGFSSVAYVELCSLSGTVATAKISLLDGRGAGTLTIPRSVPSGSYYLVCYTAQNRNEVGFDCLEGARLISVYNTFSSSREKGAVTLVDEVPASEVQESECGAIDIEVGEASGKSLPVSVMNNGSSLASVSVSVYHKDALQEPENGSISAFVERNGSLTVPEFTDAYTPEYDGEIIRARVVGNNPYDAIGHYAFISSPGDLSGAYSAEVGRYRDITFYTTSIFGDNDLVCQIEGLSPESDSHLEIDSPFIGPEISSIPAMPLCPSQQESLLQRGIGMQIEKYFDSEILYDYLYYRPSLLFSNLTPKSYVLDDYTRFPDMSEIFVEFVTEIRVRKDASKQPQLYTLLSEYYRNNNYSDRPSLVMIDGTPVFDHSKIISFDPLLVERIDIYQSTFYLGARSYGGIINFVTYKKDMAGMTFNDNVRFISFNGASVPAAYTCAGAPSDDTYPDYRQTIYWHPAVSVEPSGSFDFDCRLPAYSGDFRVVVEGLTVEGQPVRKVVEFSTEK